MSESVATAEITEITGITARTRTRPRNPIWLAPI